MNVNYVVSFPRSGHHALMGFLDKSCGLGDEYCEFYTCKSYEGSEIPCKMNNKNWKKKKFSCHANKKNIKCHDFGLSLPFNEYDKYLVQIRHPFLSIESWYQMEAQKKMIMPSWENFFEKKLNFWKKFVEKWVFELESKGNVLILRYDDMGDVAELQKVADFLGYSESFDADKLKSDYFKSKRKLKAQGEFYLSKEQGILDYLDKSGLKSLGTSSGS